MQANSLEEQTEPHVLHQADEDLPLMSDEDEPNVEAASYEAMMRDAKEKVRAQGGGKPRRAGSKKTPFEMQTAKGLGGANDWGKGGLQASLAGWGQT